MGQRGGRHSGILKESLNVTELLDPKFSNGTFNNSAYDPMYCYECEWQSYSFEGVPWGKST